VAELCLRVPAVPENVIVVRELLRGVGGLFAVRPGLSEAVLTAVSEAANNVVMHAYNDSPGPLEIEVDLRRGLEVSVRDWGTGFERADGSGGSDEDGFGHAVIAAFADHVDIRSTRGEGSEVRLSWDVPSLLEGPDGDSEPPLVGDTVLSVRPDPALGVATGRVMAALGAHARLTIDRLSELQVIGDVLVSHAGPVLRDARLSLAFLERDDRLQVSAGPFVAGGAERVRTARSVDGVGVIDRLANGVQVLSDPLADGEALVLTIGPRA
jgi:anti-sigma regulatory factor (Ser/Thr protein kinase)